MGRLVQINRMDREIGRRLAERRLAAGKTKDVPPVEESVDDPCFRELCELRQWRAGDVGQKHPRTTWRIAVPAVAAAIIVAVMFSASDQTVMSSVSNALTRVGKTIVFEDPFTGDRFATGSGDSLIAIRMREAAAIQEKMIVSVVGWKYDGSNIYLARYTVPGDTLLFGYVPDQPMSDPTPALTRFIYDHGDAMEANRDQFNIVSQDTIGVDEIQIAFTVYEVPKLAGSPMQFLYGLPLTQSQYPQKP